MPLKLAQEKKHIKDNKKEFENSKSECCLYDLLKYAKYRMKL